MQSDSKVKMVRLLCFLTILLNQSTKQSAQSILSLSCHEISLQLIKKIVLFTRRQPLSINMLLPRMKAVKHILPTNKHTPWPDVWFPAQAELFIAMFLDIHISHFCIQLSGKLKQLRKILNQYNRQQFITTSPLQIGLHKTKKSSSIQIPLQCISNLLLNCLDIFFGLLSHHLSSISYLSSNCSSKPVVRSNFINSDSITLHYYLEWFLWAVFSNLSTWLY